MYRRKKTLRFCLMIYFKVSYRDTLIFILHIFVCRVFKLRMSQYYKYNFLSFSSALLKNYYYCIV